MENGWPPGSARLEWPKSIRLCSSLTFGNRQAPATELSVKLQAPLAKVFMTVVVNKSPDEFQQFVLKEIKDWGKIVIDNNIKVE